jgi:hypothetical protein
MRESDLQAPLRAPTRISSEWLAVLSGPLSWAFGLVTRYALVPFVCGSGDTIWLHLVSIVTLGVAGMGAAVSLRLYRSAGGEWPHDTGTPIGRSRFMAALGMLGGVLFALAIVAQWLTSAFLNPCMSI